MTASLDSQNVMILHVPSSPRTSVDWIRPAGADAVSSQAERRSSSRSGATRPSVTVTNTGATSSTEGPEQRLASLGLLATAPTSSSLVIGDPQPRRAAARLRGGLDAPGGARRDASGGGPPTSALVRCRTASPSSGEIIDDCAPLAYISTCLRGAGRGTCFEFVQHPSDERVCAGPSHRLERPVEGGSDLLNASARGEIPQN